MPLAVRRVATEDLTPTELDAIHAMLVTAFGDDPEVAFGPDDWQHTLGGVHILAEEDGAIVAHASVVDRTIEVGGWPLQAGYVEAVATAPAHQGHGNGTRLMETVAAILHAAYEPGALGTGSHHFYERLGWRVWRGPTAVRLPDGGERPTPDEDGFILVLRTPATPADLDDQAPLSCDWRPGDVW